jgi:hypothetical protein
MLKKAKTRLLTRTAQNEPLSAADGRRSTPISIVVSSSAFI